MSEIIKNLKSGITTDNPIFIQMLGMCPTLAVTTSAIGGMGMGLATTVVLVLSNFVISILRKIIPSKVRIPAFIVVIATFVTLIELFLKGYIPMMYDMLGLFIPLIVVNCVILGRAESYASKNRVLPSIFDGLGIGLGFTISLIMIGVVREVLGSGTIFNYQVMPSFYEPINLFILAPGAFFVVGFLLAGINHIRSKIENKS